MMWLVSRSRVLFVEPMKVRRMAGMPETMERVASEMDALIVQEIQFWGRQNQGQIL
jgi:hypothetical protein